jgi:phage gpG-like protein
LDALTRLDVAPAQASALRSEAERLAEAVRESLSHPPGSDHATPWLRSGALRSSIAAEATSEQAIIGSTDPVAVYQELGTHTVPPRPFLAPAGAAGGEDVAREVGEAVASAIRGALQ